MTRRRLRPEELELWHKAMRGAERMGPTPRKSVAAPATKSTVDSPKEKSSARLEPFKVGALAKSSTATIPSPGISAVAMDSRKYDKLKRGKLVPEARIDLHGMTLAQAHPALAGFIMQAQARGFRLVLVITGKGRAGADRDPVLRRRGVLHDQVPHWLRMAPVGQAVLEVAQAHQRHGGAGAFYVYLRKSGR